MVAVQAAARRQLTAEAVPDQDIAAVITSVTEPLVQAVAAAAQGVMEQMQQVAAVAVLQAAQAA